jgi:ribosomal protein S18 acetylase RimI-like enzyme
MPLPILSSSQASPETLIRLYHKTEHHWTQHFAEEKELSVGSAFCNPDLKNVFDANRLLDGALAEGQSPADAVEEVRGYFEPQDARCMRWGMNPSAPSDRVEPFVDHLLQLGFTRGAHDIMYLQHMPQTKITEVADAKVIPARASFRHARALAEESANEKWKEPQLADAAMMHLDDPHWDALLALKDGTAVATLGVLAVGEIGRIEQVFVSPEHRRRGIGRTMMSRALEICARSLFKHVFLSCDGDNTPAIALYKELGFTKIGEIVSYYPRSG